MNILNKIKFYSLLSMCWFIPVWFVGVMVDNAKLAEVSGEVILYSWAVGMVCLIIESVKKECKK
jgi:hypothetical protein